MEESKEVSHHNPRCRLAAIEPCQAPKGGSFWGERIEGPWFGLRGFFAVCCPPAPMLVLRPVVQVCSQRFWILHLPPRPVQVQFHVQVQVHQPAEREDRRRKGPSHLCILDQTRLFLFCISGSWSSIVARSTVVHCVSSRFTVCDGTSPLNPSARPAGEHVSM